jgi:hypothetical protein
MQRRPNTSDFKHRRAQPPAAPRARMKRTVRTLLSAEQLNLAIARESARVDRRGGGVVSLVLFRVPGTTRGRRSVKSAARLAKTIIQRIRVTDDIGWFDEEHLGLLLPDTSVPGAWRLAQIVCDAVSERGPRPLVTMYTYPANTAASETPAEAGAAQEAPAVSGVIRSNESPAPAAMAVVNIAS